MSNILWNSQGEAYLEEHERYALEHGLDEPGGHLDPEHAPAIRKTCARGRIEMYDDGTLVCVAPDGAEKIVGRLAESGEMAEAMSDDDMIARDAIMEGRPEAAKAIVGSNRAAELEGRVAALTALVEKLLAAQGQASRDIGDPTGGEGHGW